MLQIKRIKLLHLPTVYTSSYIPPYGLAAITSFLRSKEIYVDQDDLNQKINHNKSYFTDKTNSHLLLDYDRAIRYAEGYIDKELDDFIDSILSKTELKYFDIFFLSASSSTLRCSVLEDMIPLYVFSRRLKKRFNKPIVIGGGLISGDLTLKQKVIEGIRKGLFDYCICGNGELSSFQLIRSLNKGSSLKNVGGLVYLHKGKVIKNKEKTKPLLIKPDFRGLPLDLYMWTPNKKHSRLEEKILVLPFRFVSGCHHKCAFCASSGKKRITTLPPKIVALYLKELSEEYGTKYFFFLNNHINISEKYLDSLCDNILKLNLNILWTDSARLSNLNKKLISKMRKAGCIRLVFGLETASQRLLNYIEKGVNVSIAKKILKWSNDAGIWTVANLITGLPTENDKDIDSTIKFIGETRNTVDYFSISIFRLLNDSQFLLKPKKYKLCNIKCIPLWCHDAEKFRIGFLPFRYQFNEIGGLPWEEKIMQITRSFCRIRQASQKIGTDFFFEQLLLLFYLYSLYDHKTKIQCEYEKESKKIFRRYILQHPSLLFKAFPLGFEFKELKKYIRRLF